MLAFPSGRENSHVWNVKPLSRGVHSIRLPHSVKGLISARNVSCNLSFDITDVKRIFYWLRTQNVASQVVIQVLYYVMLEKFVRTGFNFLQLISQSHDDHRKWVYLQETSPWLKLVEKLVTQCAGELRTTKLREVHRLRRTFYSVKADAFNRKQF